MTPSVKNAPKNVQRQTEETPVSEHEVETLAHNTQQLSDVLRTRAPTDLADLARMMGAD
jgi:hypothetical protein